MREHSEGSNVSPNIIAPALWYRVIEVTNYKCETLVSSQPNYNTEKHCS